VRLASSSRGVFSSQGWKAANDGESHGKVMGTALKMMKKTPGKSMAISGT